MIKKPILKENKYKITRDMTHSGCEVDWSDTGDTNKAWNWETTENARTEQRIKKMRDAFK